MNKTNYKRLIEISNSSENDKIFGESVLDRATHYRDFEIRASWERSKYFILFLGALFVAYYTMKKPDLILQQFILQNGHMIKQIPIQTSMFPNWMFLLITGLGTAISFVWYWVNRGSKLIYENWEHHIDFIEEEYGIGNISRIHCYKSFDKFKPFDVYPISPSRANTLVSLLISGAFLVLFVYELQLYLCLTSCDKLIKCVFMFVLIYVGGCAIIAKQIKSSAYQEFYDYGKRKIYANNRLSKNKYCATYDGKDKPIWTKEK